MGRHFRPEVPPRFPVGMVYIGHWTRNVYRMREKGVGTDVVHHHRTAWLDGQARHREPDGWWQCWPMSIADKHTMAGQWLRTFPTQHDFEAVVFRAVLSQQVPDGVAAMTQDMKPVKHGETVLRITGTMTIDFADASFITLPMTLS